MDTDKSSKSARWEKFEADLREWGLDLERFRARSEQAGGDLKKEYERQVSSLRPKLDQARARLQEWKKAGSAATREMQTGFEAAWAELKKAFESAAAKFK